MKGSEHEVFTGSVSMHALKGKVKLRGAGFMDNVDIKARDGIDIDANVDQKATPLAHREWDYRPKPVEKTYRNLPFTRPGYLPEGFGLQGQRFYEMAGFNLSAGGGGSSSQGFGMFGGRRNDPLDSLSGGFRGTAPYLGVMNSSNMRAHAMIGGLSDRIEEQVHEMQQEHARIEQEKRYEEELARITLNHRPVQKMAAASAVADDIDEETSGSKKKASASAKSGFLDAIWESAEDGKEDEEEALASAFGRLGGREKGGEDEDVFWRPPSPTNSNTSVQRGLAKLKVQVPGGVKDAVHHAGEWVGERRDKSAAAWQEFKKDPSVENFSLKHAARHGTFEALDLVGTGIDYAKSGARRGLRAIGVDADTAQDIVSVADGAFAVVGAVGTVKAVAGIAKGVVKGTGKVGAVEGVPQKAQYRINDANADPSLPVGSRHSGQKPGPKYLTHNEPTSIDGRYYSGHALDRMRERELLPTAVEDTIKNGILKPSGEVGKNLHYSPSNNISVVTNAASGRVITATFREL